MSQGKGETTSLPFAMHYRKKVRNITWFHKDTNTEVSCGHTAKQDFRWWMKRGSLAKGN